MRSSPLRTLALVVLPAVVTVASLAAAALPAVASPHPRPSPEGPAGPPARLPDGRVARPPRVTSPLVSASCPRPPYGPFYYAPGTGKTVALTFDDGPGKSTSKIRQILSADHVTASFFNIGENMAARPSSTRQEAKLGYMLGNHTWNHPDMAKLSASAQAAEMDRATAEQRRLTHASPCVFRPPGGDYNTTTLRLAHRRHMKVWLWSVDTEDWKAKGSGSAYWADRIVRLARQEGGKLRHPVILMHNQPIGNPATVKALPRIIRYFRTHHYRFVNLAGKAAS